MIKLLTSEQKGWLVIAALFVSFFLWTKGVDNNRIKRIDTLESKVERQVQQIEGYKVEIAELEKNRFIEEGLREIISQQNTDYQQLQDQHEQLKKQYSYTIKNLTEEQIKDGAVILGVWEFYEGVVP